MTATSHASGHATEFRDGAWVYSDGTGPATPSDERPCRACGRRPIPLLVTIPAEDSHTGEERQAVKGIDACIAQLVFALNEAGMPTRSCCCGHGVAPPSVILTDGRQVVILPDAETAESVCAMLRGETRRSGAALVRPGKPGE